MYVQVGDFRVSRGPPTVPLTRISRNTVFSKSQNPRKAGTLCTMYQGSCSNVGLFMKISHNDYDLSLYFLVNNVAENAFIGV